MDKSQDKKTERIGLYVVVTPFFPSSGNWRGAFIYDQVVALKRAGCNVMVFKPCSKNPGSYEFDGVVVHTFKYSETPSYLFNGIFNKRNAKSFHNKLKEVGVLESDINVIHCHTSPLGACGALIKQINPNIKVLLQHHDRDPYMVRNGRFAWMLPDRWYRAYKSIKVFNAVDYHITISQGVEDNLKSFPSPGEHEVYAPYLRRLKGLKFLPKKKDYQCIRLINGVDRRIFYPKPIPHEGFVIGCIANFVELKRHIDLLKAVKVIQEQKAIPKLKVKMVGSGPLLKDCKKFVEVNKLNEVVDFMPEVKHEELNSFYNSIDLFVLPTVFEGFGCVFTEAAACGIPFITVENQGAAECIDPKERDRWTFAPKNIEQLAKNIIIVYTCNYKQHLICDIDIDIAIEPLVK